MSGTRTASGALLAVMSLVLTLTVAPDTGARAQAADRAPTGRLIANLVGDDTFYTALLRDPEGGPLTYVWTASSLECGTFTPSSRAPHKAVWHREAGPTHVDPQFCQVHEGFPYGGLVTVTVSDQNGNQVSCEHRNSGNGEVGCGSPDPGSCTLDMRLDDGQGGSTPTDQAEETRGAFTVFNDNDTDGRGGSDVHQDVVPGERDLMRLRLHRPKPNEGGVVTLKVVGRDHIDIYRRPTKGKRLGWGRQATGRRPPTLTFPTRQLPLTLWVEGRRPSDRLRDVTLRYSYNPPGAEPACRDTAAATVVWSEISGVRHDADHEVWPDMPGRPRDAVERLCGGFGLRPAGAAPGGVRNCIGFQFQVLPAGIGQEPGVEFDVARQRSSRFSIEVVGDDREQVTRTDFPDDERPNDDGRDTDESRRPTADGFMYSFGGPGTPNPRIEPPARVRAFYDARFREYVRVRFDGVRPTGNVVRGSVASVRVNWAARHTWVSNGSGVIHRSTGDADETDENFVTMR